MIFRGKEVTKTSIMKHIRTKIVPLYREGKRLYGDDLDFMMDIFSLHPNIDEKKGVGFKSLWCMPDYGGKSYCFYIHRIDGTHIDISWKCCLESRGLQFDENKAARDTIEYQILKFRNENETGGDQHVDHFPFAFSYLWANFKQTRHASQSYETTDGGTKTFFKCKDLANDWEEYHLKNAELRMSDSIKNIKAGNHIKDDACPCGGESKVIRKKMIDGRYCYQMRCEKCNTFIRGVKKSEVHGPDL